MGHTLIEKIIMKNTGLDTVSPGQIVTVNVDRVMIHDIFIPFVAEKFKEMGFTRVWDPDKICLIYDHMVPTSAVEDVRHFQIGDAFAAEQRLTHVHRTDGICHQLMPEMGYARPGQVVFGTDSHTTTYGAVGCFSSGIGYTEMAAILGTGELWVRVPETIRIEIDGELPGNVSAKDVILTILGDLRADGGPPEVHDRLKDPAGHQPEEDRPLLAVRVVKRPAGKDRAGKRAAKLRAFPELRRLLG